MARPEIGTVFEPSVPADISECSIEDGCQALQDHGKVPRMLTLGADHTYNVNEIRDLARKFGLDMDTRIDYDADEWAIHDLEPNSERTTYWNVGI